METLCTLSKTWAPLAGRILLSFIFLQSGYDKMFNFSKTAAYMAAKGLPLAEVLLVPTIVILLAGGLTILFGWYVRWGALALFLFLIPATLVFHPYWTFPEAQQLNQFHHFVKNLALMGALLVMLGTGPGPMSLQRDPAARGC
ncbi:MAG: DoxX family protein [Burkholderiales bacterium]